MLSSPVNLPKWYVDLRKLCGSAGFGKMIDSRQARRKLAPPTAAHQQLLRLQ